MTIPDQLKVKNRTLRQRDDALADIQRAEAKIEEREQILKRSEIRLIILDIQRSKIEDRLSQIEDKIAITAERRRAQLGRLDLAKARLLVLQALLIELEDCVRRGGL